MVNICIFEVEFTVMYLQRILFEEIKSHIGKNKVLLLFGTRRVGKTVLLSALKNTYSGSIQCYNGEDTEHQALLSNRSKSHYEKLLEGSNLLLIDEAQAVPDIGKILKLMIDSFPSLTIIATGSSSFDLMNKSGEPLTGRSLQYTLHPISFGELEMHFGYGKMPGMLAERMVFGSYPELFNLSTAKERQRYLKELIQTYLLKDIFEYETVKHSKKIYDLLRLVAYQVGQEVSLEELGKQLGMSKNTVERYLDLLSKVFIIYRLGGYSSNFRKEVVKLSKWYFYDNGIRNAIISDFRDLSQRSDIGQLWENYCIAERIKYQGYSASLCEYHFWRTYDSQEIDLVETENSVIRTFEFKWNEKSKPKMPKFFKDNYPDASFEVINPTNYRTFIWK
jgi:uncharacterized protein